MNKSDTDVIVEWSGRNPEAEWLRLFQDAYHSLEFAVTMRYLREHLPRAGHVLDAGGGPGRYAIEFCRLGYHVTLLDLSPALLDVARARFDEEPSDVQARLSEIAVGDIRDLSRYPDGQFDVTLCLGGPVSYIPVEDGRLQAVRELVRVTRPGGIVGIGVIGYLAVLRTISREARHVLIGPDYRLLLEKGNAHCGPMEWHFFRAAELQALARSCGLSPLAMAGCEGLSSGMPDATNELHTHEDCWSVWLDLVLTTASEPAIVDMAEHILYVGKVGG